MAIPEFENWQKYCITCIILFGRAGAQAPEPIESQKVPTPPCARFGLAMGIRMRYDENMIQLIRSGRFIIALTVVVVLVLIILGLNNRVVELRTLSEEAVRYEERVQSLQHTQLALETQIAYTTSEPPVVKWAMEDIRWIRDETGEKLIIPLVDPKATPSPAVQVNAPSDAQNIENWQFWMALFFDEQEVP